MITLAPYDLNWKSLFELEKERIKKLDIGCIVRIEHVGSTAIPGIYAKPVIDILIGVSNLNNFTEKEIQKIESLGYRYNPAFKTVLPYRRYFQKNNQQGVRTHQIHLVNFPSQWYEKHILFRDYLRTNKEIAKSYESLKLTLAEKFDNTIDYTNAKNNFCRNINKKAFFNFSINMPFIETKRLIGFIPQLACHADYSKMLSNAEFIRCYGVSYDSKEALKRLKSDIDHWNQYSFSPWMWYNKNTHNYIGRGGLKAFIYQENPEVELTYQISQEFWGNGMSVEIGKAAIEYAFNTLKLDSLICFTAHNNHQSLRVMQKLGFIFEKEFSHANIIHKLFRMKN